MTDQGIVLGAQAGDIQAFTELVNTYSNAVYGVAFSRVRNYHEAQDIAQEVFLKAYLNLRQLKDPGKVGGWLYTITRRLCPRKNSRPHIPLDEAWIGVAGPSTTSLEVREALDGLSEVNRQTLVLYYLAGYNTREIAVFVGVSCDAVEKRLRRARESMKRGMLDMVEEHLRGNKLPSGFHERLERTFRLWEANDGDDDYDEVVRLLEMALNEKPNDPALHLRYGFLHQRRGAKLLGSGCTDEGMSLLKKAVSIYEEGLGNGGTYHNQLLMAKSMMGEAPEMIEDYERRHLEDPTDPRWMGLLALAYLYYSGDSRLDEAERYIRLAMEQNPNDHEAMIMMGDLNERLGNPNEAVKWWDRALETNEEKAIPARFGKAGYFEALGHIEDALEEWGRIREFHHRYHYEEYLDWVDRKINGLRERLASQG